MSWKGCNFSVKIRKFSAEESWRCTFGALCMLFDQWSLLCFINHYCLRVSNNRHSDNDIVSLILSLKMCWEVDGQAETWHFWLHRVPGWRRWNLLIVISDAHGDKVCSHYRGSWDLDCLFMGTHWAGNKVKQISSYRVTQSIIYRVPAKNIRTFLVAQMVKNLPAMQETWVPSLGVEDSLEKGMATHCSILPGESHGQWSLMGYRTWGCKESDTTEWLTLSLSLRIRQWTTCSGSCVFSSPCDAERRWWGVDPVGVRRYGWAQGSRIRQRVCGRAALGAQFSFSLFRQGSQHHMGKFISVTQSCPILCDPMDCSTPGFPVHPNSRSLPKLMSIESVMPSNHLILCHPFLLPSSILSSIRVFSNKSALQMRWPKYWSFSFQFQPIRVRKQQLELNME